MATDIECNNVNSDMNYVICDSFVHKIVNINADKDITINS